LEENIPILAIEARASEALEAAWPAETRRGALSAKEEVLGQVRMCSVNIR